MLRRTRASTIHSDKTISYWILVSYLCSVVLLRVLIFSNPNLLILKIGFDDALALSLQHPSTTILHQTYSSREYRWSSDRHGGTAWFRRRVYRCSMTLQSPSIPLRLDDGDDLLLVSSSAEPKELEVPVPPPLEILYHDVDDRYLLVNKPASVVCHHSEWTGSRAAKGSLQSLEVPILQRMRQQTGRRINLVHRLDRGASGCLLLTYADDMDDESNSHNDVLSSQDSDDDNELSDEATTNIPDDNGTGNANDIQSPLPLMHMNSTTVTALLNQAMANKTTCTKTYVALVRGEGILHGTDLKQQGWFLVDRPIKNEKGVSKNATTWFRFIAGQDNGAGTLDRARASLVLARPITGRWHQIRKHLNGLSHPILGDTTHGSSRVNREWKEERGMPGERTCLHLCRLQIGPIPELCPHGIDVSCRLAPDMKQMLHDHLPDVLAAAEPILGEEGIEL